MAPKPYGYARVEFLAVRVEIQQLFAAGHTMAWIYRMLRERGAITMGYSIFRDYLKGRKSRCTQTGEPVSAPSAFVPGSSTLAMRNTALAVSAPLVTAMVPSAHAQADPLASFAPNGFNFTSETDNEV